MFKKLLKLIRWIMVDIDLNGKCRNCGNPIHRCYKCNQPFQEGEKIFCKGKRHLCDICRAELMMRQNKIL